MLWLADWPTTDCCFVVIGGHGVSQYLAAAAKNRYSRPPNEVHRPKHLSFVSWQFFFLSMDSSCHYTIRQYRIKKNNREQTHSTQTTATQVIGCRLTRSNNDHSYQAFQPLLENLHLCFRPSHNLLPTTFRSRCLCDDNLSTADHTTIRRVTYNNAGNTRSRNLYQKLVQETCIKNLTRVHHSFLHNNNWPANHVARFVSRAG